MRFPFLRSHIGFVAAALLTIDVAVRDAGGQTAPLKPDPQAPVLDMPAPTGAQRGSSLDLTLTGSNLAEPTGLWSSFPAKIHFPSDNNNGKDNGKLQVHLEISRDAPLGFQAIRLATKRGMSNLRLFCIDDLPQILKVNSARSKATPQSVRLPCVVLGRAEAESSDYYKIQANAGECISFEVVGRRLGSAFDPQLTLFDARTGRELVGGHNNDAPGLQTDSRLVYTFNEPGDFLVEVRDTLFRGGADFNYRLRMGEFPCATAPLPMIARRGSQVSVHFSGPRVDGIAPVEVCVPRDPALQSISVAPRGANGLFGWPVTLAISDYEELLEQEPNNDPAHANRVPVPGGITGRFLSGGDLDYYVFTAKKGTSYVVEAQSIELNSPTEVLLTLRDSKANQLATTNPQVPPRLTFRAETDGDYFVTVEHLLYWFGPSETYHLAVKEAKPDFDLSIGLDRFAVHSGASTAVPISVARNGYNGPIEVRVIGDFALTGHVTIPAGAPATPKQPAATLPITASQSAPVGPYAVTLEGSAVINGRNVTRLANVKSVLSRELGGLVFPPRDLVTQIGVAVTPPPPNNSKITIMKK
jgi:hypothetical protein